MKENRENQSVSLTDRSSAVVTGIEEVISYDENNIVVSTSLGQLTLDGRGLNIVQLNLSDGIITVEGKIDAFYYMEQRERRSLFSRIFG